MAKAIKIKLTEEELQRAKKIAKLRIKYKEDVTLFEGQPRWKTIEVDRTIAQSAAHSFYGFKWKPKFKDKANFHLTDFPVLTEIRTTPHPTGFLPVQKNDPDEKVLLLFTTEGSPVMRLRGWAFAGDVKKKKWFRSDIARPCFAVPQSALRSPDELKESLRGC